MLVHCPVLCAPPCRSIRLRGLSRILGVLGVLAGLPGCLVDPPPEFEPPPLTAPIVFEALVDPPLFVPLVVDTRDANVTSIPFNIPFKTEGAAAGTVFANVWLNYGTPQENKLPNEPERPGGAGSATGGSGNALGAANRVVSFNLPTRHIVTRDPCARLSVFLHHEEDFDERFSKPSEEAIAAGRVTHIRWWLVVDANPADVSFADCPSISD